MLDSHLFSTLEMIARDVRSSDLPFGGIQLLLCGDFFQLPPVGLGRTMKWGVKGFAFESLAWTTSAIKKVVLKKVVRQAGDQTFVTILNELRCGIASPSSLATLAKCHVDIKPAPSDNIVPTKLYCTNNNVDAENTTRLESLPGEEYSFASSNAYKGAAEHSESSQKKLSQMLDKKIAKTLHLKLGAQVVLLVNRPKLGLVNGSRGIVVGIEEFVPQHNLSHGGVAMGRYMCPRVRFDSGKSHLVEPTSFFQGGSDGALARTQIPLKLAWALTVHKSQGMTLSRV